MPSLKFTGAFYNIPTSAGYTIHLPVAKADFDISTQTTNVRADWIGTLQGSVLSAHATSSVPMHMTTPGRSVVTCPITFPGAPGYSIEYSSDPIDTTLNIKYAGTSISKVSLTSGSPYWVMPYAVTDDYDHIAWTWVGVSMTTSDARTAFAVGTSYYPPDGYPAATPGYGVIEQYYFSYYNGTANAIYYRVPAGMITHLAENKAFFDLFNVVNPGDDPYAPGGASGPGGGPFNTTLENEDTDIPTYTPTQQAARMYGLYGGMLKAYNMDQTALAGFYGYMWTDPTIWSVVSKIFVDPMQAIVGLLALPIDPAVITSSAENITIANVDTGVSSARISEQYVNVDCGTVTISPRWHGYLDYSPYTRISLFLPYIGFVTLSPEDVMGKDVQVLYSVDVLTGGCLCRIRVTQTDEDDSYTQDLYQFSGNCGAQIPYCSQNYTNLVSSALQAATTVASTIATVAATGGITAPFAVAASASLASSAANMQMHVQRSGAVNGSLGFMGVQNPYLVITRPRQCLPANQNEYIGYPSYITETLGDLTGFTAVEQIHIEGLTATDDELTEIEQLLKMGVIL